MSDECCICYNRETNLIKAKCSHYICITCFFKMLDKKCPICRQNYDDQLDGLRNAYNILVTLWKDGWS
jgi:hypothetical protein